MPDLYEYAVAVHLYKPIIKRAVVDFAVGADWTPAAGDVKISIDGGAAANVTNLPTAIAMGNTAMWDYSLTAGEMTGKKIRITVSDAAAKVVEDTMFELDTYGNASAQHKVNLNDSVRAGLTALPNAAAEAAGGLYTRGAGAGQINQQTNGQIDANLERWINVAPLALSAQRVQVLVGAITNGVIVAATFGANALDAVWSTAARILTAGTNIVLAKGVGVTGLNDLDAAGVRTAVGLGAANLDAQLTAIDDFIDTEVAAIKTDTAAIKLKTDNLPAAPAAVGDIPTAIQNADAALIRDWTAVAVPAARSTMNALRFLRNKWSIAAGTLTVKKEDDVTTAWTGAVTQTAGNPVSEIDPA